MGARRNPRRVPRPSWGAVGLTPSLSGDVPGGSSPSKTGLQNSVWAKRRGTGEGWRCGDAQRPWGTRGAAPQTRPYLAALQSLGAKRDLGEILHGTRRFPARLKSSPLCHGHPRCPPHLPAHPHGGRHELRPAETPKLVETPKVCAESPGRPQPRPLRRPLPPAPLIQLS